MPAAGDGMTLLGAALQDDIGAGLGPFSFTATFAHKRLTKANLLIDELWALQRAELDCSTLHPVWMILHQVVQRALDFDFRILSPQVTVPLAESLQQSIDRLVTAFLGGSV